MHHHDDAKTSRVSFKLAAESDTLAAIFPPLSVHRGSLNTRSLLSCLLAPKWILLPVFRRADSGWIWTRFIILSSPNGRVYVHPLALPGALRKPAEAEVLPPNPERGSGLLIACAYRDLVKRVCSIQSFISSLFWLLVLWLVGTLSGLGCAQVCEVLLIPVRSDHLTSRLASLMLS